MLKKNPAKLMILILALALAVTVVAGEVDDGGAGDDAKVLVEKDVKVIVKQLGDCGEDEPDCESRMIKVFVGDDGEVHELTGDVDWVGHHGEHAGDAHHARLVRHFTGQLGGGFLGVGLTDLTPELRAHFGVPEDAGVMVSKVVDDSPASRAGLRVGDVISAVGGEAVVSSSSLAQKIRRHEDGAAVVLEAWRDGRVETFTAALEKRDAHHVMAMSAHGVDYDCGGAEDCDVEIDCGSGDCDCSVNGESIDCRELHHGHGDD